MLRLVGVAEGLLLTANFGLPLYTVVSNPELWDEPMAVIAGNLSGTCLAMGLVRVLIEAYKLVQLNTDFTYL